MKHLQQGSVSDQLGSPVRAPHMMQVLVHYQTVENTHMKYILQRMLFHCVNVDVF
jgi:hypothetical protein